MAGSSMVDEPANGHYAPIPSLPDRRRDCSWMPSRGPLAKQRTARERMLGAAALTTAMLMLVLGVLLVISPDSLLPRHDRRFPGEQRHQGRGLLGRSWYDNEKLPPELRGRDDLGPSSEAILWSSLWTFGRKQVETVFRNVEASIGNAISKHIVNKLIPKARRALWGRGEHRPDIDRLRMLVKMMEEGELVLKHGSQACSSVVPKTSGCLRRASPKKKKAQPEPIFVRLSPDGEALVWCKAADKDKTNLALGGQQKFEPSRLYAHMLLGEVMFVVKGQETDGFQQTGLPGRDHLCLALVSKANECLEMQFASEEARELWAEALRDSLWARAECIKRGLLDERIPEPKRISRLLRSRYARPVLFVCGLTAFSRLPLPMGWLAAAAAGMASNRY